MRLHLEALSRFFSAKVVVATRSLRRSLVDFFLNKKKKPGNAMRFEARCHSAVAVTGAGAGAIFVVVGRIDASGW